MFYRCFTHAAGMAVGVTRWHVPSVAPPNVLESCCSADERLVC